MTRRHALRSGTRDAPRFPEKPIRDVYKLNPAAVPGAMRKCTELMRRLRSPQRVWFVSAGVIPQNRRTAAVVPVHV
jgi:hypothetical protein